MVGIAAGILGANVLLTDLPVYIPQLQATIEANIPALEDRVNAKALDWSEDLTEDDSRMRRKADILLLSDCIYYENSLDPLVNTMKCLTDIHSTVILSYERRPEKLDLYKEFFSIVEKSFVKEVLSEVSSPYGNPVLLIKMKKK